MPRNGEFVLFKAYTEVYRARKREVLEWESRESKSGQR